MTTCFWIFGFRLNADGALIDNLGVSPVDATPITMVTTSTPGIPPAQPLHDPKGPRPKSMPPTVLVPVRAKDDDLDHLFVVNSPVFSDAEEAVALGQAESYVASGHGHMLYVKCSNCVLYKTVDTES